MVLLAGYDLRPNADHLAPRVHFRRLLLIYSIPSASSRSQPTHSPSLEFPAGFFHARVSLRLAVPLEFGPALI